MSFDLVSMLKEFGPLVGVVIFFIWRDWKREQHLSKRLEKLEDYYRGTLVHLVERGTTALVQNSEVMKWVGRVVERLCDRCPHVELPEKPGSD